MTNLKKILIAVLAISLLVAISSAVLATDDFGIIPDGNTTVVGDPNNTVNNPVNDIPTIVNPANTLNRTTNNTANTSTYNNTNTNNLPKTGVGDYTMITAIILLAIVAVYAYKKVSDYKNI